MSLKHIRPCRPTQALLGGIPLLAFALTATAYAGEPPAPAPAAAPPAEPDADETDEEDAPAPPDTPTLLHDPAGSVPAAQDWNVHARILAAHKVADVLLHYRAVGEINYKSVRFNLVGPGDFEAVVPANDLQAGVLEYWIGSHDAAAPAGPERLHFASPDSPHPLLVVGDNETRWRKELLAQHLGNRSRFLLTGEYVDFGVRRVLNSNNAAGDIRDHYWRGELDYTYRMLAAVYSIRLGVGLIRGDTYSSLMAEDPQNPMVLLPSRPDNVGLTYGYAEVRFRLGRLVRLDLKTVLGAGPSHFDGGAGGQLLIGYDPGTHFALGIEGISSVGVRGWLRLAWNTVPRVPMSFTIEITDFPVLDNVAGRIYVDAAYRFSRYFSMKASVGYATRDWSIGGPSAGLAADFEF